MTTFLLFAVVILAVLLLFTHTAAVVVPVFLVYVAVLVAGAKLNGRCR
jgi:hypothetical protein